MVVAASLIVVVSFYGGRIGNDIALGGRPMPIRFSTDWDNSTGQIKVTVVNRADEETTLTEIYVNGILDDKAANVPQVLLPHQEVEITLSATYMVMPIQITIKIHTENYNFSVYGPITFIEFEMLRVYWDESTGRIRVLVENTGEYPEVNFGEIYVNGTLDDAAVIARVYTETKELRHPIYEISLSGTYVSKPTKMLLKITTADGKSFELVSPFDRRMEFYSIQWDESTGKIKFQAYIPTAHYLEKEQDVTFDEIYVNGTLDDAAVITRVYSETYEIVSSKTYINCPSQVTIKVITDFGAFCETTDGDLMKNPYG